MSLIDLVLFLLSSSFIFSLPRAKNELRFTHENLTILNDTYFKNLKAKNTSMIVMYFGPFCQHCHDFAQDYIKLSDRVKKDNFPFKICTLNGMEYQTVLSEENITVFPTMVVYHKNTSVFYEGGRTEIEIYDFLKRVLNGPIRKLKAVKEIEEITKESRSVLLTTIDPEKEKKSFEDFSLFADLNINNVYVSCHSEECIKKYKSKLVYLRNFDEPLVEFEENLPLNLENIINFEKTYNYPLAGNFTDFAALDIFKNNRTSIIFFRNKTEPAQVEKEKVFKEIHKEWRKKLAVFVTDIRGTILSESLASVYGVGRQDLPYILLMQPDESMRYNYNMPYKSLDEINKENINEFIKKFFKGLLKKTPISEVVPEKQEEEFTVAVGKSFKKEVYDNDLDVLVYTVVGTDREGRHKFGDPWMNMAHIFNKTKELKMVGIEITMNDIEEYVPGQETRYLLFLKGKKDKPITFVPKKLTEQNMTDINEAVNWVTENTGLPKMTKEQIEEKVKDLEKINQLKREMRMRARQRRAKPVPEQFRMKDDKNKKKEGKGEKGEKKEEKVKTATLEPMEIREPKEEEKIEKKPDL